MTYEDSHAYFLGRPTAVLCAPYRATDTAYGATRLDDTTIANADFAHCTFANISFKKAVFQSSTFLNCIFIGCYFRRAELSGSRFIGCRFIDCNFSHVAIKGCDFTHSSFRECQLPFSELEFSMPSEPNLKEDLARNLFLESSRLGLSAEARRYRIAEIRAREVNLLSAALGSSQWYKEHYDGLARLRALRELVLSYLNRWLWGYGERARVLLRNLLLVALVLFPLAFFALSDGLSKESNSAVSWSDCIYFSLENVLPGGFQSGVDAVSLAARITAGVESFFGIVALALFASYVFRWSLHR